MGAYFFKSKPLLCVAILDEFDVDDLVAKIRELCLLRCRVRSNDVNDLSLLLSLLMFSDNTASGFFHRRLIMRFHFDVVCVAGFVGIAHCPSLIRHTVPLTVVEHASYVNDGDNFQVIY